MNLKSTYILVILVTFLTPDTYSQVHDKRIIISISPFAGIPVTKDLKDKYGLEIGGSFGAEYVVTDYARVLLQFGAGTFRGKSYLTEYGYDDEYPSLILTKLRAGGKYFVNENGLFVTGLVGAAQYRTSVDKLYGYSLAPGLGYELITVISVGLSYEYSKFKTAKIGTVAVNMAVHL